MTRGAIAIAAEGAIPQCGVARQEAAKYRPDIDGLRAVAIATVFVFHANHAFLPGGFVGVDVFFVISGFLIIRIILDGLETKTFSLGSFYARRIRRIFPALIVALAAVWWLGWYFMLPQDFLELGKQVLAGAAFSSNLLMYSQVGYFDAPAISKPLLHLWSLGVEEQFYLVTPLALIAAFRWRLSVPLFLSVRRRSPSQSTSSWCAMTRPPPSIFPSPVSGKYSSAVGLPMRRSIAPNVW